MKKFIKKYKLYFISFLCPIILLGIYFLKIYIFNGLHTSEFLYGDGFGQYAPLFSYYKDVLSLKDSFLYSFSKPFSGEMISTFAYYLASPLNIFLIFFSKKNIPLFFISSVLIKIGLCSLTLFIYLKSKYFKNADKKFIKNNNEISLLIFSIAYSLMSYNISYYFNVMWLDVIALTPLVVMGIDKIFDENKSSFYILFLFLSIFSNFYIAYMLCIFIFFYFIYKYIVNYEKLKKENYQFKIIYKFIFSSILAALMASPILIPTIIYSRGFSRFPNSYYNTKYNFIYMFVSRLFIGSHVIKDSLSKNSSNIFFGVLPLILSFKYFFNKNIIIKKRILSFITLILFILSFLTEPINIFWHGGSLPNGYIFRFSYLFILFMILIGAENYYNNDNSNDFKKSFAFILCYLILGIISCILYSDVINYYKVLICIVFSFTYLFLFDLNDHKKIKLLIFILLIEELININYSFFLTNHSSYSNSFNKGYEICNSYNKYEDNNHRIDIENNYMVLSSLICGTKATTGIITTNNKDVNNFGRLSGMNTSYTGNKFSTNASVDSLLGINYIVESDIIVDNRFFDYKDTYNIRKFSYTDKRNIFYYNIYNNKYALNMGYLINNDYSKFDNSNPFTYQNNIYRKFTGNNKNIYNIYERIDYNKDKKNFKIKIGEEPFIYLYLNHRNDASQNNSLKSNYRYININGIKYNFDNFNEIITIKNRWKNETVDISSSSKNTTFASIDEEVFKEDINILNKNMLNIKSIKGRKLFGSINSNKNGYLLLTIPYDKNIKVYVNGKEKKISKATNAFIKLKINKGNNKVVLKYVPSEFYIGLVISILFIITFIYLYKNEKI